MQGFRELRRLSWGPGCGMFGCAGLGILLGALGGIAGLVIGICSVVAPGEGPLGEFLNDLSNVDTRDLPGHEEAFDSFAALPEVQEYAGENAELVSIEVNLVRADGTQELNADYSPQPRTYYTFVRKVERPDDAPPPGAGGANAGPWYERVRIEAYDPGQRRTRTTYGGSGSSSVTYTNKGLEKDVDAAQSGEVEIVPAPICSIPVFFARAALEGAPADAVANVTYDSDGYSFTISGLGIYLEFDTNCEPVE